MKNACTLALLGCPNCGKTTLFNLLTGQAQRTGNWPGVTVQLTKGHVSNALLPAAFGDLSLEIVDLPGANALSPHSPDEAVPLQYLMRNPPDAVILVIDSCAPAQGLYLLLELLSLRLPTVLAFNMADRLQKLGGKIDLPALEKALHVPCLFVSARKRSNVPALLSLAIQAARQKAVPPVLVPFDNAASAPLYADLAGKRYQIIDRLLKQFFTLHAQSAQALDRIALHPLFAYSLLFLVLLFIFYCAFGKPGQFLLEHVSALLRSGVDRIALMLKNAQTPPLLQQFLTDGLFGSMTGVLAFLPTLLLFFFLTALLEDSGYMARSAFILDALLKRIGLTGRSFFPLMTGLGCSVPAILSVKSLPTRRERLVTSLLIPYLPCSAKQPVMLFLCAYCFRGKPFVFVLLCYLLGVSALVLIAILLRQREDAPPLMTELPAYHLPTLRGALRVMRDKTRDFITRAFTVIFFTAIIVWFMQAFTPALQRAQSAESSLLFSISRLLQPLFTPLGFASPYTVAALFAGLMAKENILTVLLLSGEQTLFDSPAAAASFLVFSLLYTPCFASCCALCAQMESRKRMLSAVLLQTGIAWLAALVTYRLFS